MKSSNRQLGRWSTLREKGFRRFVLIYGVLGWGLSTGVIWALTMSLLGWSDLRVVLPTAMVLFPIVGWAWGAFMWWFMELLFQRHALSGKR